MMQDENAVTDVNHPGNLRMSGRNIDHRRRALRNPTPVGSLSASPLRPMKTGTGQSIPVVPAMSSSPATAPRTTGPTGRTAPAPDARLEQGFERSFVPVALVDLDGRFLRVNAALCAFLGRDASEVVGHSVVAFTHPDDVLVTHDATRQLSIGDRQHVQVEKRYVRPDGSVVWGLAASTLIELDARRLPLRPDPGHHRPQGRQAAARGVARGARRARPRRPRRSRPARRRTPCTPSWPARSRASCAATSGGHPLRGRRARLRPRDARGARPHHGAAGNALRSTDSSAAAVMSPRPPRGAPRLRRRGRRAERRARPQRPQHRRGRPHPRRRAALGRPRDGDVAPDPAAPGRARAAEPVRRARGRRDRQRERARGAGGARVDRPADGPREPPHVPRAARGGGRPTRGARAARQPGAARRRPLQAGQRHDGHQVGDAVLARGREAAAPSARPARASSWPAIGGEEFAWLLPETDAEAWALAAAERVAPVRSAAHAVGRRPLTISAGVCRPGPGRRRRRSSSGSPTAPSTGRRPTAATRRVRYRREVVEALSAAERAHAPRALAGPGGDPRPGPRGRRQGPDRRSATPSASADWPRSSRSRCGWPLEAAAAAARRRPRPRRRQDRRPRRDPAQARPADARTSTSRSRATRRSARRSSRDILPPSRSAWVRHHHERWDGAGLPGRHRRRGDPGRRAHPRARRRVGRR